MAKSVSSIIEDNDYLRWKRSGLKLRHVIGLGLHAAEGNPQLIERQHELEEGNAKLQKKLTYAMMRINELEAKVK